MLYLIPTPIWNRDDITVRAMKLLKELKYLICEDTRTTMKLLQMYEIEFKEKELMALTSFTDQWRLNHYLNIMKENDVWVVSEAWTPGLSDPGKNLVKICNENNISYSILPGANALVPAVVWAWFDTSEFTYLWFLPQKKWRQTALRWILESKVPVFFYESVHRFEKLLKELREIWFGGQISVARELSKMFEQYFTWDIEECLEMVKTKKLPIKGEFVVWIKN